jgi:hypothetical protein
MNSKSRASRLLDLHDIMAFVQAAFLPQPPRERTSSQPVGM